MRAYSQDLRDRVISAYKAKMSIENIIETHKICMDTAKDWINRFETTGDYSSKQAENRIPCRFTDKKAILKFIENNPDVDR